ncbi:MAG: response regulator [Chloroflexota bacterium]
MIRVLLADDHTLMRQGTRALLTEANDIEIVAETERGEEAIALAAETRPDVAILDIRLSGLGGVEVARRLRDELPATKILILTAYDFDQYVRALFAVGVEGYLLKHTSGNELIAAVRSVYSGRHVLSPEIEARERHAHAPNPDALTDREIEILTLVSRGESNKEIAQVLGITPRTAEWHVGNVMAKLGARSRTEAIRFGRQQGIINVDE